MRFSSNINMGDKKFTQWSNSSISLDKKFFLRGKNAKPTAQLPYCIEGVWKNIQLSLSLKPTNILMYLQWDWLSFWAP